MTIVLLIVIAFLLLAEREPNYEPVRIICPHCHRDYNVAVYALHVKTHD